MGRNRSQTAGAVRNGAHIRPRRCPPGSGGSPSTSFPHSCACFMLNAKAVGFLAMPNRGVCCGRPSITLRKRPYRRLLSQPQPTALLTDPGSRPNELMGVGARDCAMTWYPLVADHSARIRSTFSRIALSWAAT